MVTLTIYTFVLTYDFTFETSTLKSEHMLHELLFQMLETREQVQGCLRL
jgi:hypothetical protein